MNELKRWIVTMGGVGYLPASGTFASLLTCGILFPILSSVGNSMQAQSIVAIAGTIVFSVLNVGLGKWAVAYFKMEDPGKFVLDEAAGICLSIVGFPGAVGWKLVINLALAFGAFRLFDITKPAPARQLENLPDGWGILLDDLAAAVYANILCQILIRFVLPH
jgi:phosphatidylglycerophosphatase A